MTWKEFLEKKDLYDDYDLTNIECPLCGEKIYKYKKIVFTTFPVKHRYNCLKCGWSEVV